MSIEAIKLIREAESHLEQSKKHALQQSRQIVAKAHSEGDSLRASILKDAAQREHQIVTEAEEAAKKEYEALMETARTQSETIAQSAKSNIGAGVDIIFKRIVSEYGDR